MLGWNAWMTSSLGPVFSDVWGSLWNPIRCIANKSTYHYWIVIEPKYNRILALQSSFTQFFYCLSKSQMRRNWLFQWQVKWGSWIQRAWVPTPQFPQRLRENLSQWKPCSLRAVTLPTLSCKPITQSHIRETMNEICCTKRSGLCSQNIDTTKICRLSKMKQKFLN